MFKISFFCPLLIGNEGDAENGNKDDSSNNSITFIKSKPCEDGRHARENFVFKGRHVFRSRRVFVNGYVVAAVLYDRRCMATAIFWFRSAASWVKVRGDR